MMFARLSVIGMAVLGTALPGLSQSCQPNMKSPEVGDDQCPVVSRSVTFTGVYPDKYEGIASHPVITACALIQMCAYGVLNNGVQDECGYSYWGTPFDGGYGIGYQNGQDVQTTDTCGALQQQYIKSHACSLGPQVTIQVANDHACQGCTWHRPDCSTNACQICVNNQCQSQCGAGLHCDGAGSCCANGCSGCQPSCSNVCGSACLDCPVCPCGFASGCSFGSPQCPPPPCNPSPIVLDAFDQGYHLTSIAQGVKFRVRPNDPLRQISWTDPRARNGWLALDRNGNGTIDDFTELFGNLTPQPWSGAPNGFLALAVFDDPANGGNGNGVIDPGDAVYGHLRVWVDANHNGISEPNELYTLQQLGIFKIGLRYHSTPFVDQYGNRFRYRGTVWDDDSHSRDACYDVFLQIQTAR